MGYLSRLPTSNERRGGSAENPWSGENDLEDLVALKLSEQVVRCRECKRITHKRYITADHCPDCKPKADSNETSGKTS